MSIFRLGDQQPPEPRQINDDVVMRFEHVYEVDPSLMELTGQQPMPAWDTQRIVDGRWDHLDWMHDHFADEVLLAGEESETTEEESVMGENGMRWSFCMLPDYPLEESIDMIKTADELGFYAAYSVDETWHKDLWVAVRGRRRQDGAHPVRPERHARLPARADADLPADRHARRAHERAHGAGRLDRQLRAARRSTGSTGQSQKPLSRLKEAIHVMRTFLADGAITFEGDFFKYNGLYTFARPGPGARSRSRWARMKGPRSFQAAGEIAEGLHHALSYSREAYDYMAENIRDRRREGRAATWQELDLGAWVVTVVSDDSAAAKRAARILVAFYISSMPPEQLARHGIDAAELQPVVDALGAGDIPKAVELFKPEYAEKLSLAGHARGVRGEDQGRHRSRPASTT